MVQPKISLDIEVPEDVKEMMASKAKEGDMRLDGDSDKELDWSADSRERALDHLLDFDHDLSQEALPPPVRL